MARGRRKPEPGAVRGTYRNGQIVLIRRKYPRLHIEENIVFFLTTEQKREVDMWLASGAK